MALSDFRSANTGGALTPEQVNIAFQDMYGIDAPQKYIDWYAGHNNGGVDDFYRRVASGAFSVDLQKEDPRFLEQSKIAQLTQQQIDTQKKYNAPLIPTLEASKTSLQARYDAILADLTNTEGKDSQALQKSTSAEFAKRGIPLTSDAYTRELASQLHPVNQDYSVKRGTFAAQNATDQNAIDKAIADLKAGKPDVAIPAANALYGNVSPNAQAGQNYSTIALPTSQQAIKKSEADIQSNKFTDLSNLIKQFQGIA